jgi:hypothetical protein
MESKRCCAILFDLVQQEEAEKKYGKPYVEQILRLFPKYEDTPYIPKQCSNQKKNESDFCGGKHSKPWEWDPSRKFGKMMSVQNQSKIKVWTDRDPGTNVCGECSFLSNKLMYHEYYGEHHGTIIMKNENTSDIIMSYYQDYLIKEKTS